MGIGGRGEAVCFPYLGLFVNLCCVRLYVSVLLRDVDLNS